MRELDDVWAVGLALATLGRVASARGDYDLAIRHNEVALALWERLPGQRYIDVALTALGWHYLLHGDHARSRQAHVRLLEHARHHDDPRGLASTLIGAAGLAAAEGNPTRAARLFAAAAAHREEVEIPLASATQAQHDRLVDATRDALGEAAFAAAWAVGRALPLEEAVAEAAKILAGDEVAAPEQAPPSTAGSPLTGLARAELTPREVDVLRLLVEGRSDKEIAAALFITRRTASQYVSAILAKLGAPSRTAAATTAVRDHLV